VDKYCKIAAKNSASLVTKIVELLNSEIFAERKIEKQKNAVKI